MNNPEADFEVFVMNPKGKKVMQLTENAVDDFDPTLSPDGRNLTNNGGGVNERDPHFSPDAQKIAYDSDSNQPSNPEGDDEVYLMNSGGSRQQNLTTTGSNVDDVTPDFALAQKS